MTQLNTEYYVRCIATLERAFGCLQAQTDDAEMYAIYRAACVKEFEIILGQSGKLLKKCLRTYFASGKQVDSLNFKDVFRYAAKHGLMTLEASERWMVYRDNRNETAHDYGEGFAEQTLLLLPQFIQDARQLNAAILGE